MLLNVRRTRLERGLRQEAVANQIGVSAAVLSRVERGVQLPWPALRARLAHCYHVPESELFSDVDRAQAFLRQAAGEVDQ
jgi:transcriptional regulator with XRE-family HTH domain